MGRRPKKGTYHQSAPQVSSPPPVRHVDWKNNPLMVAGGSAAATIVLCITVFTQIVLPTQTAKLENDALRARERTRELEDAAKKHSETVRALSSKNENLEKQVKRLASELLDLRQGDLFSYQDPFPKGLGSIRLNALTSEIDRVYAGRKIQLHSDDPTVIKVAIDNSPFGEVSYSYKEFGAQRKIVHIAFSLRDRWSVSNNSSAYLLDNTYMIMSDDVAPLLWRD